MAETSKTEKVLDAVVDYALPVSLMLLGWAGLFAGLLGWEPNIETVAIAAFLALAEVGVILTIMTRNYRRAING